MCSSRDWSLYTGSRFAVRAAGPLLAGILLWAAGCDARSLGQGDGDGSIHNHNTNVNTNDPRDATVGDPCAPMDAQTPPNVRCGDPTPIGWGWNGSGCYPVVCECAGADCGGMYASEALCYAHRAPDCLPAPPCTELPYGQCEERPDCRTELFGGGCIDLETCNTGGPQGDSWLCWEQGMACVPVDHPCHQRARGDCDGDCYWWERELEGCFDDVHGDPCCVEESWGFCAPLPGRERPGCAPQQIQGCSDPCAEIVGYQFTGLFCEPIRCCCEGPDCAETYATLDECVSARAACLDNPCGAAGGYCLYGDYVPSECQEGYGADWRVVRDDPQACGLGVCCTPCPDPTAPGVWYFSEDPQACQDVDIDCQTPDFLFDNECGCGCLGP